MSNLDMTLDDMIKMNRTSRTGPRASGRSRYWSFRNRSGSRAAPYTLSTARVPKTQWECGMLALDAALPFRGGARVLAVDTGTKLLISNLHYKVSDDDIKIFPRSRKRWPCKTTRGWRSWHGEGS
ncbi:hypothetical protein CDL12_15425 [Handroanthus impetiginosus]|uniref:Uncharacterized protein n=1 Tax=Handroanthus impetiginosus TaxID=429701 RepID=A0A2G9H3T5_9LAMI|nr:hypothetical protein CDL12_15425 [Handroanthus impetiginosus]